MNEKSNESVKKTIGSKEIEVKPYHSLPCALELFKINGIDADMDDFGESGDSDPYNAPDYCCGCWKFKKHGDIKEIKAAMEKYSLTWEEFYEIGDLLEETLYVGECSWCS